MTVKVTSADGTSGCLIWVSGENYMFRVYDDHGAFKDYDIRHSDLNIKIVDSDAAFYEYEDGALFLDHSPETLGK